MSQGPGLSPLSEGRGWRPRRGWGHALRLAAVGVLLVFVGFAGWTGLRLWSAWRSVERIDFAIEEARAALPLPPATAAEPDAPIWDPPDGAFTAYLLIGSDASDRKEIASADSIMLFLDPRGGGDPILVSLPRDLVVTDPCTGEPGRLAASLSGCAGYGGAEVVALAVEGFTGIAVDHFAIFTFDGFAQVVDELGGVELCLDHPFRANPNPQLPVLEAGCHVVDGAEALYWVRSRTPQELIDGEWVPASGGDASRIDRQQQFMLAVLSQIRRLSSVNELVDIAADLGGTFAIDDGMSVGGAISQVWNLRGLSPARIIRPKITTTPTATATGAYAVVAVEPFPNVLVAAYPEAAAFFS